MQEFLNELSTDLIYIKHEIEERRYHIYCESKNNENKSVHARQERVVRDLPIGDKEVMLHIISKRYYLEDGGTYAESFDFLNYTGRRTQRMDDKIVEANTEGSVVGTERTLKNLGINISDTTIIRLLKKKKNNK